MTFELLLICLAIVALLLISAFFSGSETALTAVSRPRMHKLEKDGNKNARLVNQLIATKERLIGTILLGNNLVNILASALTTSLFMNLFGGGWCCLCDPRHDGACGGVCRSIAKDLRHHQP